MKDIVREKLHQHPYIQKKLRETGDRELIEVSPVDSFWGWGPDRNGRNELGKIWMELREELYPANDQAQARRTYGSGRHDERQPALPGAPG